MYDSGDHNTNEGVNIVMLHGVVVLVYRRTDQSDQSKQQSYKNAAKERHTEHNVCVLGNRHCWRVLLHNSCAR